MKRFSILFVAIALMASSCKTEYLTHAMFQNDVQYMAKAHSRDSVKTNTYVSGVLAIHGGDESGSAYGTAGMLNIYQSHTLTEPNLNIAYGVFGYAGNYQRDVSSSTNNTGLGFNKSFAGIGANLSVSGYIPGEKADWRVLGVDMVYTKEFGDYLDFRRKGIDNDDYTYFRSSRLFTLGLFTEVLIKNSKDVSLGFKVGVYNSPGQPHRVEGLPVNNVGFTTAVGYRHLVFIGSLKFLPSWFLLPSGLQIGGAYRF